MRRRLRYILGTASTILAVCFLALWIRSYWVADFVGRYRGDGGAHGIIAVKGSIHFYYQFDGFGDAVGYYYGTHKAGSWGRYGRFPIDADYNARWGSGYIVFPHAVPCAIFSIAPIAFIMRRRKRNRRGFDVVPVEDKSVAGRH